MHAVACACIGVDYVSTAAPAQRRRGQCISGVNAAPLVTKHAAPDPVQLRGVRSVRSQQSHRALIGRLPFLRCLAVLQWVSRERVRRRNAAVCQTKSAAAVMRPAVPLAAETHS